MYIILFYLKLSKILNKLNKIYILRAQLGCILCSLGQPHVHLPVFAGVLLHSRLYPGQQRLLVILSVLLIILAGFRYLSSLLFRFLLFLPCLCLHQAVSVISGISILKEPVLGKFTLQERSREFPPCRFEDLFPAVGFDFLEVDQEN